MPIVVHAGHHQRPMATVVAARAAIQPKTGVRRDPGKPIRRCCLTSGCVRDRTAHRCGRSLWCASGGGMIAVYRVSTRLGSRSAGLWRNAVHVNGGPAVVAGFCSNICPLRCMWLTHSWLWMYECTPPVLAEWDRSAWFLVKSGKRILAILELRFFFLRGGGHPVLCPPQTAAADIGCATPRTPVPAERGFEGQRNKCPLPSGRGFEGLRGHPLPWTSQTPPSASCLARDHLWCQRPSNAQQPLCPGF